MLRVVSVKHVRDYILEIKFDDDSGGELDISKFIPFDGVFDPLNRPEFFKRFRINKKWGTLEWPGNLDLDTEALHSAVTGKPVSDGLKRKVKNYA